MALLRCAMGLSAVCECGISCSYSLTIFYWQFKVENHTSDQPLLMIVFQRNQSNTARNGTADMYASGHPQHLGVIVLTVAQKGMR